MASVVSVCRAGPSVCSADFQSAVSPTCSRQGVGLVPRVGVSQRLAECNSAIQRSAAKAQPNTLSSIGWRRGGAPLLGPLPTTQEWGEEEGKRAARIVAPCDDF